MTHKHHLPDSNLLIGLVLFVLFVCLWALILALFVW